MKSNPSLAVTDHVEAAHDNVESRVYEQTATAVLGSGYRAFGAPFIQLARISAPARTIAHLEQFTPEL